MFQRISSTILAVLILIFGIVSPALAEGDSSIVGTWDLSWDWNCDGTSEITEITFDRNGTMFDNTGNNTGKWIDQDGMIIWQYTSNNVYAGHLIGEHAAGASKAGSSLSKGCFTIAPLGSLEKNVRSGATEPGSTSSPAP